MSGRRHARPVAPSSITSSCSASLVQLAAVPVRYVVSCRGLGSRTLGPGTSTLRGDGRLGLLPHPASVVFGQTHRHSGRDCGWCGRMPLAFLPGR